MNAERRLRTETLIGQEAVAALSRACVMVLGLGGVGGYALEALVRAGVGSVILVDGDVISESNCNRQILAMDGTIGHLKTEIAAERARGIQSEIRIEELALTVTPENVGMLFAACTPDFIIDAIDTVTAKLAVISEAKRRGIPVISCMGTGNKLDPSAFQIGDISKSSVCPLARVIRTELRKRGIAGVTALWSTEEPIHIVAEDSGGRHAPASISYVPAVAGMMIGGYVIRRIAGI